MNALVKVIIGALMVVLGVYSSVTFWQELLQLAKASVGPLLVLVGAFIVWLETDELKMEREQKKQQREQEDQGLRREFTPQNDEETQETGMKDYSEILSGNVEEVKNAVREMANPDYEAILKAERQGKDRKTVKEFLERRVD